MKLSLALAAALTAAAFATAATAAGPVTGKLQARTTERVKPVAGGAVFVCEGDTCTAATPAANTLTVMGCRELVRAVGPLTAYGSQSRQLSAERLAECNGRAAAKAGGGRD